ncbi:MAG: hypothetical protein GVY10_10295 [Verrucomicrobia bacterium]|jgi:hypothetical protein|nr:hypothetical protein [Verrucomicrobiota bacterium]
MTQAAGLLAAVSTCAGAEKVDYYLDLMALGGAVEVSMNGFPVAGSPGPQLGYSRWITPILVDGANRLEVFFLPDPGALEQELTLSVVRHPHDGQPRDLDSGEKIFHEFVKAEQEFWLSEIPPAEIQLVRGSRDAESGRLVLKSEVEDMWSLHMQLEEPVTGSPDRLDYLGLSASLEEAELILIGRNHRATMRWEGLGLKGGMRTLDLPRANLASGHRWLVDPDGAFDTIILRGRNAEAAKVELISLKLISRRKAVVIDEMIDLDLPHEWSWEQGENVHEALADPDKRGELIDFLKQVHTVIDTRRPKEWGLLFETKTREFAAGMYKSVAEMEAGREAFFAGLAGTPGWGLQPFDASDLRIYPVNTKVVEVTYMSGRGPIISKRIAKPGSSMKDTFAIPLQLARIDGQWVIIR